MSLSHNSTKFNATPYYDDFDSSKNYLKMLFRPGRGVQARELSQIQAILQNQVEEFGSHIFENGAVIAGGEIAESLINYVRVDKTNPLGTANLNKLVGEKITDGNSTAEVFHVLSGSTLNSDSYEVVFYQHTTQGSFSASSSLGTTGSGHAGLTFSVRPTPTTIDPAPAVGTDATLITVNNGVFFVDGYFVQNSLESISPFNGTTGSYNYRSFATPTSSMGWSVSRSIKTAEDDSTLRDPASGFYNYNAPGADRYKIALSLVQKPFSASLGSATGLTFDNESYVELVRMVGGSTTKTVRYTDYSGIEETLARRTYDESGNYTVNAPSLDVLNHGDVFSPADDTKIAVAVSPNKSYITGYEVETQGSVYLEVDKSRDKALKNNEFLTTDYGNSVLVNNTTNNIALGRGVVGSDSARGFNAIDGQSEFTLRNSSETHLGTCRLRTLKRGLNDNNLRAHIYDVALSGGNTFGAVSKMVLKTGDAAHTGTTGCWWNIKADTSGFTGPFDASKKSLLYELSSGTVSEEGVYHTASNVFPNFVLQKQSSIHITGGATKGSISLSDYRVANLSDDDQYLVVYGATAASPSKLLSGSQYDVITTNVSPNTITLKVLNSAGIAPAGGASASVMYPVVWDPTNTSGSKPYRTLTKSTQTLETTTSTSKVFEDGITWSEFTLDNAHIKSLSAIQTNGQNVPLSATADVVLDDGNREGVIKNGVIKVKESVLNTAGAYDGTVASVDVTYDYFAHSGYGPVTVDSYIDANVAYTDVPSFTDRDSGKRYSLRNFVDFRPVKSGATPTVTHYGIPYWNPSVPMSTSYVHYLPRVDKVVLGEDKSYKVVKGSSAIDPKAPLTGSRDMDMFHILLEPYVFDKDKDIKVRYIDNQRLTMKQLSELDEKVDTSFNDNYLENLKTSALSLGSSNLGANDKVIEDGVFIDDFSSHAYADTTMRDHNCSVNAPGRGLRPPYDTTAVRLKHDNPSGLNISSDGICTYKFVTESAYEDLHSTKNGGNLKATGSIQINPYGATDYLGSLRLLPTSDTFYDTSKNPKVLVNEFGENNAWMTNSVAYQQGIKYGHGSEFQEWSNHWLGESVESDMNSSADPENRMYNQPVKPVRFRLPNRLLDTVGDKTIDRSVVHYMKSVGVTFEADGLLPGSTVYALLDGTPVGASGTGYSVGSTGSVRGSVTIPKGTFTTGVKQFRITDSKSNILSQTNTAADASFYALGCIPQSTEYSESVRPVNIRRKSAQSTDIMTDLFDQNQSGNFSSIVNGLEPLSQEIIVDSGAFPQGMFLEQIKLYFKEVDSSTPVTLQIRPMYNGGPHPYVILPHSEVTLLPTTIGNGPSTSNSTSFTFTSPVYLRPGKYAVCLLTNSPNNRVFRSVVGSLTLDTSGNEFESAGVYEKNSGSGVRLGSMFFPLNNGSRMQKTDEVIAMTVGRCKFDANTTDSEREITFTPVQGSSADAHIITVTGNEPIFSSSSINTSTNVSFQSDTYSGIVQNKSIVLNGKINASDTESISVKTKFSQTTSNAISPVIDAQRVSILASKRCSSYGGGESGGVLGELQPTSAAALTTSRYVSKIISLDNAVANHVRVFLDARVPSGSIQVFIKTDDLEGDFDDNNFVQLFTTQGGVEVAVPNQNPNYTSYEFKPLSTSGLPPFSRYQIKILTETPSEITDLETTVVKDLRVVPITK